MLSSKFRPKIEVRFAVPGEVAVGRKVFSEFKVKGEKSEWNRVKE
jgi:hypothetical protein